MSPTDHLGDVRTFGPDDYRAVMRHWPSGVAVITMMDGGRAHGMTASAFTSVSANPSLILVVVDQRWRSHTFLSQSKTFCVSFLRVEQADLSDRFAGRHGRLEDQFDGVPTLKATNGVPYLADAAAFLACRIGGTHVAGDHTIFVGEVTDGGVLRPDAEPLVYHQARYRQLVAP